MRSLAADTHHGIDCVARGADGMLRYAGFVSWPWGTIAQQVAVRPGLAVPEGADPALVTGSLNPELSSWLPLVVGAPGVAGRLAMQNALLLGADRVVGLGRDPYRLAAVTALGGIPVALADGSGAVRRALTARRPRSFSTTSVSPAAELVWDALAEDHADMLHVQIGATGAGSATSRVTATVRTFPLSDVDEAWRDAGPDRAVVVPD